MSAKIDLSTDTSLCHIPTNPNTELLSEKSNILEKNPLLISLFTYYSLKSKSFPFLKC